MGFAPEQLRDKALLALEEVVQECRYRPHRRTIAIRFALAYLWAFKPGRREPYDEFWKALALDKVARFGGADRALSMIYAEHGLARDEALSMQLWERQHELERADGKTKI
jgi:hypothetical protein